MSPILVISSCLEQQYSPSPWRCSSWLAEALTRPAETFCKKTGAWLHVLPTFTEIIYKLAFPTSLWSSFSELSKMLSPRLSSSFCPKYLQLSHWAIFFFKSTHYCSAQGHTLLPRGQCLGQEQRCDPDPGLRVGAFLGGPGNCILMSGL